MTHSHIQIVPITSLSESTAENIIIEITHEKDITWITHFDIDQWVWDIIKNNLKLQSSLREKTLVFAYGKKTIKKIIFFFPDQKSLMDERSSFFQNLQTKSLFIPSEKGEECHECLTLATYKYQDHLSFDRKNQRILQYSLKIPFCCSCGNSLSNHHTNCTKSGFN